MGKIRDLLSTSCVQQMKESGEKHFFTKTILKINSGEKHINPFKYSKENNTQDKLNQNILCFLLK